jgi:hypothetical protein
MSQANTNPGKTLARFPLGKLVATPAAIEAMKQAGQNPHELFQRHQRGDWGEVCPTDAQENELSVKEGFRVMSVYVLKTGVKVWVITEADRSASTILMPEDY